jgi:hypothetical protein
LFNFAQFSDLNSTIWQPAGPQKGEFPMDAIEASATIAFCLLDYRGQSRDPTLHQIACAVTQAAALFDAENVPLIGVSARRLIRRHAWQPETQENARGRNPGRPAPAMMRRP